MEPARRNAWLLTLASACVLGASLVPMARRVAAFNAASGVAAGRYHFEPITSRDVRVEGFPDARLDDALTPEGRAAVRLTYAGSTTLIPVKAPPAKDLPGLAAYDEWLKVLAVYEVGRDEAGRQVRLAGSERVWIVVRRTPEGVDPRGWGQSRRTEWVFDFYDLRRDGTVDRFARRWPGSEHAEKALEAAARGEGGRPPDPTVAAILGVPRLRERTPEYGAAMHVIPKLNVPQYRFNNDAFSPAVLGWTLPASMLSGLALTGGLVFALAPRRRGGWHGGEVR
jgi:hypothetical protein